MVCEEQKLLSIDQINRIAAAKLTKAERARFEEVRKAVNNADVALDFDEGVHETTGAISRRMWAYSFYWTHGLKTHVMVDFEESEWTVIIDKFLVALEEWCKMQEAL